MNTEPRSLQMAQNIWKYNTESVPIYSQAKSPIAILWHCAKDLFQQLYFGLISGHTRGVTGQLVTKQFWSTDHSVLPAVSQTRTYYFTEWMYSPTAQTQKAMELNTYRYLVNITNLYLYLFVYTHNGDGTFQSHRAIHTHECEISYIVWNCVPVETFHGINISFQGKNTDPWFLERQVTLLRAYLATTST